MSATDGESARSLAHIKQKLTFFHKKFTINSIYGEYTLEARDIPARSFKITKGERSIANISKKYFSTTNTYSVSIAADENQAFILALVIVINQILYTLHWQTFTILK